MQKNFVKATSPKSKKDSALLRKVKHISSSLSKDKDISDEPSKEDDAITDKKISNSEKEIENQLFKMSKSDNELTSVENSKKSVTRAVSSPPQENAHDKVSQDTPRSIETTHRSLVNLGPREEKVELFDPSVIFVSYYRCKYRDSSMCVRKGKMFLSKTELVFKCLGMPFVKARIKYGNIIKCEKLKKGEYVNCKHSLIFIQTNDMKKHIFYDFFLPTKYAYTALCKLLSKYKVMANIEKEIDEKFIKVPSPLKQKKVEETEITKEDSLSGSNKIKNKDNVELKHSHKVKQYKDSKKMGKNLSLDLQSGEILNKPKYGKANGDIAKNGSVVPLSAIASEAKSKLSESALKSSNNLFKQQDVIAVENKENGKVNGNVILRRVNDETKNERRSPKSDDTFTNELYAPQNDLNFYNLSLNELPVRLRLALFASVILLIFMLIMVLINSFEIMKLESTIEM